MDQVSPGNSLVSEWKSCMSLVSILMKILTMFIQLFSHSVVSNSLRPHGLQHTRVLCSSPSPTVCLNSCPLSQWCHPVISSSVVPFSSCPQSFQVLESFPVSWLFASGGQSIAASASAIVLPMNIPLGLTSLISLNGLASDQTIGREHSSTHLQKIGLKIYWAWPCPPEQDPVFPTAIPSHQKAFTCLFSSFIKGQAE